MAREIHIWLGYCYPDDICITNIETQRLICCGFHRIDTGVIGFCNSKYLEHGFRIFVHMIDNEEVEIKFGDGNVNTNRYIHPCHNLEKLLMSNEFGLATADWYK